MSGVEFKTYKHKFDNKSLSDRFIWHIGLFYFTTLNTNLGAYNRQVYTVCEKVVKLKFKVIQE